MLTAHQITKSFGIHPVLHNVSFNIRSHDRIGLIGPNGSGKTTLMRILAGFEQPDYGNVIRTQSDLRIGYLPQGFDFLPGDTFGAFLENQSAKLDIYTGKNIETKIAELAYELSKNPTSIEIQNTYDACLSQQMAIMKSKVNVLESLGLADFPANTPINQLSGGQKTRLLLAKILLQDPNLLLLDEPTNHLDISMLEWLETWLSKFNGSALIVSHDRAFLDNTVNSILELASPKNGIITFHGNYTSYLEQKMANHERQLQAYSDQQVELDQLRKAAQHIRGLTSFKKGGKSDGGDKFAKGFFGNRATKNTAGRAKNIEARIEKIIREDRIEKPRPSWQIKIEFGTPNHQSRDVIVAENLAIGYPGCSPLLTNLNFQIQTGQRIAITGSNGIGKTSLFRTMIGKLNPLSGAIYIGAKVRLGYMSQEQELLDPMLSPLQSILRESILSETEARNFLHFFLFSGDDPLRPIKYLSYGERARLQLAILVVQGCTCLLLDEPINHLDIPSRARFEQALAKYQGTVVAVVHDRYFIQQFARDIWRFENGELIK